MGSYCLVLTSCPDKETASLITEQLLDQRLAACVSHLADVTSYYHWQGQREVTTEVLLLIKSREYCYDAIEKCIRHNHPYELPEIVRVAIDTGLPEYLHWIDTMTGV